MKTLARLKHAGGGKIANVGIKFVSIPTQRNIPRASDTSAGPGKITLNRNTRGGTATFMSSRYKLVEQIGRGGSGILYKATDKVLDASVAIKFLPGQLMRDKETASRFKREANIAMRLSHEHIVKLHNLETEGNRMFLVMEYVGGKSLRTILAENGRLKLSTCAQVAASCAMALDYAHERNVLHLDLKPDNLMLTEDCILKIIDFGTARRVEADADEEDEFVEGTPTYMSPEQLAGDELDLRTDIYSLGAVIHELLAGKPPYSFNVSPDYVLHHPPEGLPEYVPPEAARAIRKAMARRREDRWPTAGDFADCLIVAAGI